MPTRECYQSNPEHYKLKRREYATLYPERAAITRYKHSLQVRQFLQDIKTQTPCADCGKQYAHYIMEFDHVNGEPARVGQKQQRVRGVGALTSQRWSVVLKELAKCEIVCANCHRVRTWNKLYAKGDWGDTTSKNKRYRLEKCSCFGTNQQKGCAVCGGLGVLSYIKTADGEVEGSIAYCNQPKKKCPHGHLYTPDNIIWDRGYRQCRKCKAESDRKYYQNKKQER